MPNYLDEVKVIESYCIEVDRILKNWRVIYQAHRMEKDKVKAFLRAKIEVIEGAKERIKSAWRLTNSLWERAFAIHNELGIGVEPEIKNLKTLFNDIHFGLNAGIESIEVAIRDSSGIPTDLFDKPYRELGKVMRELRTLITKITEAKK